MIDIKELFKSLGIHESLIKPVLVALFSLLIWFVILILKKFVTRKIEAKDVRYHTRKFLDFIAFIIIILIIVITYSSKLNGIGVALGVAGAGIAFALQQVIVSFAGWLSILFGRLFITGDRVQLGGIKGDVIDIGVLRTTLMETGQWVDGDLYNGRIVTVANNAVFQDAVFNYSADFPFLWDEIKIPLQYSCDQKLAKETFLNIAVEITGMFVKQSQQPWDYLVRRYMIEDARTDPMVTITVNSNWVEYTLRYLVAYKKRRNTKDLLFDKILDAVNKSNGALKFASSGTQVIYMPSPEKKD